MGYRPLILASRLWLCDANLGVEIIHSANIVQLQPLVGRWMNSDNLHTPNQSVEANDSASDEAEFDEFAYDKTVRMPRPMPKKQDDADPDGSLK